MNALDEVKYIDVPSYIDPQGILVAYSRTVDFNFEIERVFIVSGYANSLRGKHAHKALNQILICIRGSCNIICDDGNSTKEFILDNATRALIIPNGIWAEQRYNNDGTTLIVLCDQQFDENDYIRDYKKFLNFRGK